MRRNQQQSYCIITVQYHEMHLLFLSHISLLNCQKLYTPSRFIAQCVPAERVAPFFPLLSAHLSCAMTHIEPGIQEDAMKILDVLLDHYPALLAARPAILLTNFLELISHRRTSGGAKKPQETKARSWALSVNPTRAVTSQQWRLTVLLRYRGHRHTQIL